MNRFAIAIPAFFFTFACDPAAAPAPNTAPSTVEEAAKPQEAATPAPDTEAPVSRAALVHFCTSMASINPATQGRGCCPSL
ncbi:MAG TPA: hypothetical protein DFR83_17375 [Deltaproteobacteria bacterium]|nr:hypothetical protein [Deltaproteobacteria bacterium]